MLPSKPVKKTNSKSISRRKPINSTKIQPEEKYKNSVNFMSRLGVSKNTSEDDSKKVGRPLIYRLPKLQNANGVDSDLTSKGKQGLKKDEKPTKLKSKYANVSSSGYGRSTYNPGKTKTNPSATSILSDKTSRTIGTSSYISSQTLPKSESSKKETQTKKAPFPHPRTQPKKREVTLPKLPAC